MQPGHQSQQQACWQAAIPHRTWLGRKLYATSRHLKQRWIGHLFWQWQLAGGLSCIRLLKSCESVLHLLAQINGCRRAEQFNSVAIITGASHIHATQVQCSATAALTSSPNPPGTACLEEHPVCIACGYHSDARAITWQLSCEVVPFRKRRLACVARHLCLPTWSSSLEPAWAATLLA